METSAVISIVTTGIAVAAVVVSLLQARAMKQHNMLSVRPVVELWIRREVGGKTGIVVVNRGMGPAFITQVKMGFDGMPREAWNRTTLYSVRDSLQPDPGQIRYMVLKSEHSLPSGFEEFLLHVDDYDSIKHASFWNWINSRMMLEIGYKSLYGPKYTVELSSCVGEGP